jgi:hypothetical protein
LGGASINGLAAYAYLALGTRHFGATDFSGVSVLWSIWAVTGAAVVFPIQHEVTRRLESGRGEAPVRDILAPLGAAIAVLAVAVTIVTWTLAEPLFGSDRLLNPIMAGWIVAGAGYSGLIRGALGGRRRFVATGMALGAENVARLAGAIVVLAAGWSVGAYTLAMGLGPLALLVWIGSLRFTATGQPLDSERGLAGVGRTFGGLAGAAVISQVILTSSPVALALTGGAAASVTSLFAALAVFRAPYLLLLGVTARVTGTLTRAVTAHDEHRLRQAQVLFLGGSVALAVAFGLFGFTVGEKTLQLLFGPTVELDRADFGWLGIGSGLAMGGILLVLLLLARGRSSVALGAWLIALVPAGVVLAIAPSGEVGSVVAAFVAAEVAAVALLAFFDQRVSRATAAAVRERSVVRPTRGTT